MKAMPLHQLMLESENVRLMGSGDVLIARLVYDSRLAGPGAMFAALSGESLDGSSFVGDAIERGASAVLVDHAIPDLAVPQVISTEPRKTLAEFSVAMAGYPSSSLSLVGVTGTNGKTTVAYVIRHLLRATGRRCGMLGTIEYDTGRDVVRAPLTTPESTEFCAALADMVKEGCEAAVAEVSSHALSQHRVWGHRFACGVFTTFTRDHLDYHESMSSYLAAKKRLFDMLPSDANAWVPSGLAVIEDVLADCPASVFRFGLEGDEDLTAGIEDADVQGTRLTLNWQGDCCALHSPLVGQFNVMNVLAGVGAVLSLGVPFVDACKAIETFRGVPGRLERIVGPVGRAAFVDYAHTDDALRTVLQTLRPLAEGRVHVVFGCGGDRDSGKRPLMLQAALDEADAVVLTSDNPRTEDPQAIIADCLRGTTEHDRVAVEPDRRQAVAMAVAAMAENDVLLVAGKGHEDYQIVGTARSHLDDRELVREAFGLAGKERSNECV